MKNKYRIVFICTGLYTPGGIERAIINLANSLTIHGNYVRLLILDKRSDSFYQIHPDMNISTANLHFGISPEGNVISRKIQFVKHIKQLQQLLSNIRPEIVIGTEYALSIAAYLAYGKKAKLISWEHHHFYWIHKNKFWQVLFKLVYPKLDKIVCLNSTEAALFSAIGCKTTIIPNFTLVQSISLNFRSNTLLTVGWLIKRKGIDLIPAIAEKVKKIHPGWHWKIIGEGPLHDYLQTEISKRDLKHFVSVIPPNTPILTDVYMNTSLYVMTSRFECFPMVLLEAMALGIPAIAFDCPTGPADIIQNGVDGWLVELEDTDAMAAAICNLIEDEEKRKKMGENAHRNIQRFSPDKVLALWEKLFAEI